MCWIHLVQFSMLKSSTSFFNRRVLTPKSLDSHDRGLPKLFIPVDAQALLADWSYFFCLEMIEAIKVVNFV